MATTPIPIAVSVLASETDLYTAFSVVGASAAMLISLDLCNTGSTDITIDVYYKKAADGSKKYFGKTTTVPALGTATWRGMETINTSGDKWCAIASATNVDATGTVMENA